MKSVYFLCLNALRFVPYAYGLLKNYAEADQQLRGRYRWHEPIHEMAPADRIAGAIVEPDVLCASCYVWNHNRQLAIAKQVKERRPDCRVVFGGPHVPDDSEAYLRQHPFIDFLVHGEGEIALCELLRAFLEPSPVFSHIRGISYLDGERYVNTAPARQLPKDLPLASPYLDGSFTSFYAGDRGNTIALWETNRGCPYACAFCDWGVRTMNKLRRHDMEKLRGEIAAMAAAELDDLYVTDCNFGIFERDLEITRMLVKSKQKTGYPKRVRIQFAKNSNDRVFEISRLLHENDMLWGTTLSMQSVDMRVLEAVNRRQIGIDNYRKLERRYRAAGIPTYTELILGLPLETRESFVDGVCKLFEIGLHEDVRVFELALLPNAPLSRPDMRKKYGLKTEHRPLRLTNGGETAELVELVFATGALPPEDWAFCLLFGEAVQALHNGAYTRFVAVYLHDRGLMSYRAFYTGLLEALLKSRSPAGQPFQRIRTLIHDFAADPQMPQINRVLTQPDMAAFLSRYNPRRRGWALWTYVWMVLSEIKPEFYEAVGNFLESRGIGIDEELGDLLRYQQEIMLDIDYDPAAGKTVEYERDWFGYFFEQKALAPAPVRLRYTDERMGVSFRYPLTRGNPNHFVNAALGLSYPYSKFRHFFHQPDRTERIDRDR